MSEIAIYKAEKISKVYYKVFSGVYEDFLAKAKSDYKFELEPIGCDEFLECVDNGILECIILLEDSVPTGFLTYTTLISEALELNLIHCLGNSNLSHKRRVLLEKFLQLNEDIIKQKVVTYPMLGNQSEFTQDIRQYDFKIVNQAVVRFYLNNPATLHTLKNIHFLPLPEDYKIVSWDNRYVGNVVKVLKDSFAGSSDRLFDPRFNSNEGCFDIVTKIVKGVYGKFLQSSTKILMYKNKPCGICFANLTCENISNIPLIGILPEHRHKGLSEQLLRETTNSIINLMIEGKITLTELNASVDTDNFSAVKMYRKLGFKEDYRYPQAYLPASRL